jgi:hypothetical protein
VGELERALLEHLFRLQQLALGTLARRQDAPGILEGNGAQPFLLRFLVSIIVGH